MTLSELMAADVGNVFLNTNDFAEDVTHRPADVSADDVTRTVVFIEDSRIEVVDAKKGKKYMRNATIRIPSDVTITKKDTWIRNSEKWQTKLEGGDYGGMKQVHLTRVEQIKTEPGGDTRRTW